MLRTIFLSLFRDDICLDVLAASHLLASRFYRSLDNLDLIPMYSLTQERTDQGSSVLDNETFLYSGEILYYAMIQSSPCKVPPTLPDAVSLQHWKLCGGRIRTSTST